MREWSGILSKRPPLTDAAIGPPILPATPKLPNSRYLTDLLVLVILFLPWYLTDLLVLVISFYRVDAQLFTASRRGKLLFDDSSVRAYRRFNWRRNPRLGARVRIGRGLPDPWR